MKPRIIILADFPWSFFDQGSIGRGGGQSCTWLTQLAEEFSKQDTYEIHWITINHGTFLKKSKIKKWGGQHFHLIYGLKRSIDLRLGLRFSRWTLLRKIRKIKPSIVHCWGTETAYPSVCGHCNVPVILSMQGILSEYSRIGGLPDMYYWNELARREPLYLKRATVVTSESRWGLEKALIQNPFIKNYQIEYGVHSSFYDLKWNPDFHSPYVVYAGSIDYRKGLDLLIDAMSLLGEKKWKLKIIGDGPLRENLESRGVKGVEWLGLLDWKKLQQELSHASCLIVPTRSDTGPSIVKECRVVGLPVIGSSNGGLREYIRNGENGIIVNPLEPAGLAEALTRLMDNPELIKQMGACHHQEDRAYFRPEHTATGFMKVYSELLDQSAHPLPQTAL